MKPGDKVKCITTGVEGVITHVYKDMVWFEGGRSWLLAKGFELVRDNAPSAAPGQAPEADKGPSAEASKPDAAQYGLPGWNPYDVAAALQKLVDQRDTQASRFRGALVMMEQRAEAAEKECIEADQRRSEWQQRAEAAEQQYQNVSKHLRVANERLTTARASKAQLIREVREWLQNSKQGTYDLAEILTRHEQDTAEHPDTKRLRELLAEAKEHYAGEVGYPKFLRKYDE